MVFASSQPTNNYVDAGGFLHTNFALSAGWRVPGARLARRASSRRLTRDELPQSVDISYGLDSLGQGAYFSHPTPGAANDDASAVSRGVVISEIMYHPSSELVTEEYIEIYNGEAATVNLGGWTLAGGVDMTLPAVALAPGQRLVIAANAAGFAAKYPTVTNFVARVGGQALEPLRGDSASRQSWASRSTPSRTTTKAPGRRARSGRSISTITAGCGATRPTAAAARWSWWAWALSNDWGQNWRASTVVGGTPGAANSTADADGNVAPLILQVSHSPIIPRSTDPVVIRRG